MTGAGEQIDLVKEALPLPHPSASRRLRHAGHVGHRNLLSTRIRQGYSLYGSSARTTGCDGQPTGSRVCMASTLCAQYGSDDAMGG